MRATSNIDRVAVAARNNAAWYRAMFRAHGLPDEISPSVWLSRATPPPYHSNLVVISDAPNDAMTHILGLMDLPLNWTLKDSFHTLALGGLGFEVLFEATWIWRAVGPTEAPSDPGWTRIKSPAELLAWEEGWMGDAGNAGAQGRPAQFPPFLLADPDTAFFACHRGRELVAGGIANRAAGAVGLSNVFIASGDARAVWAGLIDAAQVAFPGLPLVGYQRGAALEAATACGFEPIGPLRVWMRRPGERQAIGRPGNNGPMPAVISLSDSIEQVEVLALYTANHWSSAEKPVQLLAALRNSHALVTARVSGTLVGIGNAISDGHLVVYFPHLLVHPDFQGQGIGRQMMQALLDKYRGFHQLMLVADGQALDFYRRLGFERAGHTEPMWIYAGHDH